MVKQIVRWWKSQVQSLGLSPSTDRQSGVGGGSGRIEATELRSVLRVLDELRYRVLLHVNER